MTMRQTVPPSVLAVSLSDAKDALRIDGDDMDAQVAIWVGGVVAALEHEIGMCMMPQAWEVSLGSFYAAPIELPHPVISVTSVEYVDVFGVTRTIDPATCRIKRGAYSSHLLPPLGTSWPATFADNDVVTIVCQCGHGDDASKTPVNVKLYVLARLQEQFDPITGKERSAARSPFVERLLDACRVYQ